MRVYKNEYIYIENFFNGNKRLFYNNEELFKNENGNYEYKENDEVKEIIVEGSLFNGVKIINNEKEEVIVKSIRWYELLLTFSYIGFLFYGNDYIVSAIIAGIFGIVNMVIMRGIKNVFLKIVASILTACVCALVLILAYIIIKEVKEN